MEKNCPRVFKNLLLFLAFSFFIVHYSFAEVLKVKLQAGEFEIIAEENGDTISASTFGTMQIPGKPVLPSKIFFIAIPPDAEVSKVWFDGDDRFLDGTYYIEPGSLSLPARNITPEEFAAAKLEYQQNFDLVYSSNDAYPAKPAEYIGGGGLRKYKLVRVRYTPWQYFPLSGRILFTTEITVNIEYDRLGKLDASISLADTANEDIAAEMIFNYGEARQWYPVQPKPLGSTDYPYIIMCTDATRDAVEPLADWKRSIGYRVNIFTKEWLQANTSYPGVPFERQIRYYLRDNYATWNAQYFLIVADTDIIPMRSCTAGDGGTWPSYTDTYYGELSQLDSFSWDYDWDGNYAERTQDSIDWAMELSVGRIPDNDPAVVQAICEKIRDFEMDTGTWKLRSLHLGGIWNYTNENGGGGEKSDHAYVYDEMFGDWSWTGWTRHTMYEQAGIDPSVFASTWALTRTNVQTQWRTGQYALVNFGGHGYTDGSGVMSVVWNGDWNSNGRPDSAELSQPAYFVRADIASLDDAHPSIVIFADCDCGLYNSPNAGGKELLHTGGVATISSAGNVQYTLPWYDESYGRIQTFQYLWNKRHVNSGQLVGKALMSAKSDFAASYNWDNGTQQILLNMNLYGDPALLRSGTTQRPNFDYYWPANWDYIIVPRSTADGSSASCPVSYTLPGNSDSTYLNFSIENNGNIISYQVYNRLYIDDIYVWWTSLGWLDPGSHYEFVNSGPITVNGGRHTVKVVYDPLNECTESNESDNSWSKQYVWSPYVLADQTPVWRSAPPERGSGTYYNCDGFQFDFGVGQYWSAVGIMPYNSSDDYDIRFYTDYVNSTDGFDTSYLTSEWGAGSTDFIIANRNILGTVGPFYAGVYEYFGGNSGFRIQQGNSSSSTLSKTTINGPFTIHTHDVVDMHEVYLTVGTWKVVMDCTSGSANLGLTIYDESIGRFTKSGYRSGGYSNSSGSGGDESCTFTTTTAGWYGIAVWKTNSADYGLSNTYYIGVSDDLTAPTPNPMTWNTVPYAISTTSIGMVATTASDPSGVEYFFECQYQPGGGGTDSGWQDSTSYVDSGLAPNDSYGYVVTARDKSPLQNQGSASSIAYIATLIETPTGITFGTITETSIQARSTNTPSNLNIGNSGLYIENVTKGTESGRKTDNSFWTSSGLSPNTTYAFRARARNMNPGIYTPYCANFNKTTYANVPGYAAFSNILPNSIQANWTTNGNPAGTQYYCENFTTGQNSGWITNTTWNCTGLAPETIYGFRVKARNSEGIETGWCMLGLVSTLFVDNDSDGLPDSWEQQIIDDDPFDNIQTIWDVSPNDDYDGDGEPNGVEYCARTDPTDPNSYFAIVQITRNPSGSISVFWKSVIGEIYAIEYSDDPMGPAMIWHNALYQVGATTELTEFMDDGTFTGSPPSSVQKRYYRVMVYGACGG